MRRFNRSLDPASRYAFLSFRFDETTSQPGWTEARYDTEIRALVADIQNDANARTFIVDDGSTGFGEPRLHVVTTKNVPALRNAYTAFVAAMVSNTNWSNRVITAP